jgi:dynein heavy chain
MKYDKDNIAPEIIEKIMPYVKMEEFAPKTVKRSSVAAAGLCQWVHAMVTYDRVARVVAPKKAALATATATLKEAQNALAEKQAALQEIMNRLQTLQDSLNEAMKKKDDLNKQVEDCSAKLDRAERLISGLGGERTVGTRT